MLFVSFKFFRSAVEGYSLIASAASKSCLDGFPEKLEAIRPVDCILSALRVVEDNKSLTLGLEVFFGDNVDNGSEFAENDSQGLSKRFELDALLEVLDIDTIER